MAKDWAEALLRGHRKGPLPAGEHERLLANPYFFPNGTPRYMGAEQRKRGIRYVLPRVTEEAESVTKSVTVTEKALPESESVTERGNAPLTPAEKQRRYRERKKAERNE